MLVAATRPPTPEPVIETRYEPRGPLDLGLTLAPLAHGRGDPSVRVMPNEFRRASWTSIGPGTLRLVRSGGVITATAWGPGAEWLIDGVPELLGAGEDLPSFEPHHGLLRELSRRFPGVRLPRTRAVLEALVPAVIEQKVTGLEARRSYRALTQRYGVPAPGPMGLMLPAPVDVLRGLPSYALHPLGLERRRAETLRLAAFAAVRLEETIGMDRAAARGRLLAVPGVGPWTTAEVMRVAHGDPDALSVGDYHVPSIVTWALAGEPRGTDERMLELLAPYAGQRARVVRLLEVAGFWPPRYGPRMAPRRIGAM